jgi:Predicted esterase of the alpha-beta hydrolase superfamily
MKGLLLEGGGMRSLYSAGVMDAFEELGISFDQCHGVSAGALNAISFLSHQPKRNLRIMQNYIDDHRYLSYRNWLFTGSIFGQKMLFDTIPNQLDPFDYEAFKNNPCQFYIWVYNLKSGTDVYHEVKDMKEDVKWLQATASLPFMGNIININGEGYIDGGIIDCYGIDNAINNGCTKMVVILTREKGFRKVKSKLVPYVKIFYHKYPNLARDLAIRHVRSNNDVERIEQLEKEGKVLIIRPTKSVKVARTEKNKEVLTSLYYDGYNDAMDMKEQIKAYLG